MCIRDRYYTDDHLRRYGFHGTSHRFVSKRCIELMGGVENAHRVIVCHLGNGSSPVSYTHLNFSTAFISPRFPS